MPKFNELVEIIKGTRSQITETSAWPFEPESPVGYQVRTLRNITEGSQDAAVDVFVGRSKDPTPDGSVGLALAAGTRIQLADNVFALEEEVRWHLSRANANPTPLWDPFNEMGRGFAPAGSRLVSPTTGKRFFLLPSHEANAEIPSYPAVRAAGVNPLSWVNLANAGTTGYAQHNPPAAYSPYTTPFASTLGDPTGANARDAIQKSQAFQDAILTDAHYWGPLYNQAFFDYWDAHPVDYFVRFPGLLETIHYNGYALSGPVPEIAGLELLALPDRIPEHRVFRYLGLGPAPDFLFQWQSYSSPAWRDVLIADDGVDVSTLRFTENKPNAWSGLNTGSGARARHQVTYGPVTVRRGPENYSYPVFRNTDPNNANPPTPVVGDYYPSAFSTNTPSIGRDFSGYAYRAADLPVHATYINATDYVALYQDFIATLRHYFHGFETARSERRIWANRRPLFESFEGVPLSVNNSYVPRRFDTVEYVSVSDRASLNRFNDAAEPFQEADPPGTYYLSINGYTPGSIELRNEPALNFRRFTGIQKFNQMRFTGVDLVGTGSFTPDNPDDDPEASEDPVQTLDGPVRETIGLQPGIFRHVREGGFGGQDTRYYDSYGLLVVPQGADIQPTRRTFRLDRGAPNFVNDGTIVYLLERFVPASTTASRYWARRLSFESAEELVAGVDQGNSVTVQQTVYRAVFELRFRPEIQADLLLRDSTGRQLRKWAGEICGSRVIEPSRGS